MTLGAHRGTLASSKPTLLLVFDMDVDGKCRCWKSTVTHYIHSRPVHAGAVDVRPLWVSASTFVRGFLTMPLLDQIVLVGKIVTTATKPKDIYYQVYARQRRDQVKTVGHRCCRRPWWRATCLSAIWQNNSHLDSLILHASPSPSRQSKLVATLRSHQRCLAKLALQSCVLCR
jgi:hypothetical protein